MIKSPYFFWSGILLGFIGCLFYGNFREPKIVFDDIPLFAFFTLVEHPILLPQVISEWIPSFLHIIGMSFFTAGLIPLNKSNYWKIPLTWLVIDLTFEALQALQNQNMLTWGDFEWVDVLAMFVSAFFTLLIFKKTNQLSSNENLKTPSETAPTLSIFKNSFTCSIVFGVGAIMMLGSYRPGSECLDCGGAVEPIYLSWNKIRSSGNLLSQQYSGMESIQLIFDDSPGAKTIATFNQSVIDGDFQPPLKNVNKIYTYNNLLLINEKRTGVHIFDNSDPSAPVFIDFISLIGNQDMAIKDNYLYLDSFTDLVVFDLNNLKQAPTRTEDLFIFPDGSEHLPLWNHFNEEPDESKGVVIGYINYGGYKVYFWPDFDGLDE